VAFQRRFSGRHRQLCDNCPMSEQPRIVRGHCPECSPARKAYVGGEHQVVSHDDSDGTSSRAADSLGCCGCERLYFRRDFWVSEWEQITDHPSGLSLATSEHFKCHTQPRLFRSKTRRSLHQSCWYAAGLSTSAYSRRRSSTTTRCTSRCPMNPSSQLSLNGLLIEGSFTICWRYSAMGHSACFTMRFSQGRSWTSVRAPLIGQHAG
jgi:hypothetical protein